MAKQTERIDQPYRPTFVLGGVEDRGLPTTGHCPSCRAEVTFSSTAARGVCPACDAQFATAVARTTRPRLFRRRAAKAPVAQVAEEPSTFDPQPAITIAKILGATIGGFGAMALLFGAFSSEPHLIVIVALILMLGAVTINFVRRALS